MVSYIIVTFISFSLTLGWPTLYALRLLYLFVLFLCALYSMQYSVDIADN